MTEAFDAIVIGTGQADPRSRSGWRGPGSAWPSLSADFLVERGSEHRMRSDFEKVRSSLRPTRRTGCAAGLRIRG